MRKQESLHRGRVVHAEIPRLQLATEHPKLLRHGAKMLRRTKIDTYGVKLGGERLLIYWFYVVYAI